jgi:hypothetical protein
MLKTRKMPCEICGGDANVPLDIDVIVSSSGPTGNIGGHCSKCNANYCFDDAIWQSDGSIYASTCPKCGEIMGGLNS